MLQSYAQTHSHNYTDGSLLKAHMSLNEMQVHEIISIIVLNKSYLNKSDICHKHKLLETAVCRCISSSFHVWSGRAVLAVTCESTWTRDYTNAKMETVPQAPRCGVCSKVPKEFQIVSCCKRVFCKDCISVVTADKKLCPQCEAADYNVFSSVTDESLSSVEGHSYGSEPPLDERTGGYEYIDCPNRCGQYILKDEQSVHLASSCPKREFTCQYCNFKATYEIVSNDHWPQCPFYPVPCPNACGIQAIERGDLDAHLLQCPLEEIECEFSYAGCNVKLAFEDVEKHMKECVQQHLVLLSAKFRECQEQLEKQSRENAERIQDLQKHMQICYRFCPTICVPYYAHRRKAGGWWHSPSLYTHPQGYKFRIAVNCKGVYSTHISVSMDALRGEFDGQVLWPANATVTLQLLNQESGHGHLTVTRRFRWPKPAKATYIGFFGERFISHGELSEFNPDLHTRFLINDSLFFRVRVEMD